MELRGTFTLDDTDIVSLESHDAQPAARRGWVNIAPYAVKLNLGADGNLTVETYELAAEYNPLQTCITTQADITAAQNSSSDALNPNCLLTRITRFVADLDALGFADPDGDVNGADCVDIVGKHIAILRELTRR